MKVGLFVNRVTDYTRPVFESLFERVDLRVYAFRDKIPSSLDGESFSSLSAGGYWLSDAPLALREDHDILIAGGLNYFTTHTVSLVAKLTDTPLILWTDEWAATQNSPKHRLLAPAKRAVTGLADGYLACGSPQAKFLRSMGASADDITVARYSACTIPPQHAWEVPPEAGNGGFDASYVLYLGRLVERKGIFDLVRAFERQKAETQGDYQLVIAGKGSLAGQLADQCRAAPETSIIPRYVSHAEKAWLLANASVTCLPSRAEPWGITVTESLSLDTPVITSTEVAAALDHVAEGHNGFVIPAGDQQALVEALGNLELLDMDHSAASAPVTEWTAETQADRFYERVSQTVR